MSSRVEVCGVKDPVRNLPWLKAKIEDAKAQKQDKILTITVGKLKGEPVLNFYLTYMSCIGCVTYHCDGSRVELSKYTQQETMDFMQTIWGGASQGEVIWPEK